MREGIKRRRWSSADDDVLIECLKANVNNLHQGFAEASERLQRTPGACSVRWYTVTTHKAVIFGTYVDGGVIANRKVADVVNKDAENMFRRFLRYIHLK